MPDSNLFYWYDGNKILLNPSTSKRAVKFIGETDGFTKANTIKLLSNSEAASEIDLGNGITLLNTSGINRFHTTKEFENQNNLKELMVFEADANKNLMILTDEIILKLKFDIGNAEKDNFFTKYNDRIKIKSQVNEDTYVVAVIEIEGSNTLEIANELNNDNRVSYAHPNFIRSLKPLFSPNDPLFNKQWALKNDGQTGGVSGNDINVTVAWTYTKGSDKITIAIIDEGVDYFHEDLNVSGKLVTGYDAVTATDNPNPENDDAHGTACAGIAAGAGNNSTGIAGVAPGCKILGIRIAKTVGRNWLTDDVKIADGIEQAYKRGADVLSNSWAAGSVSMHITQAIRDAKKFGRNGKGCVICFAAGNDNGRVSYPGNLPEVITVAACNEFGERKALNSKDGETWWGSNYGPEIDVCAPGVHITTTDITGSKGYNKNDNYTDSFNGTSAATPHVAGVAALVLSVNPNLTVKEVETILRNATDDLGTPGFNQYTGFGRINAGKAVGLA